MQKTEMLRLRLSQSEKEAFEEAASLSGIAVSAWVRERLRSAARRELVDTGRQVPFLQASVGQDGD